MNISKIFILFFYLKFANSECVVRINELNIIDPVKPENREFVELKVSEGFDFIYNRSTKAINIMDSH